MRKEEKGRRRKEEGGRRREEEGGGTKEEGGKRREEGGGRETKLSLLTLSPDNNIQEVSSYISNELVLGYY